MQLESHCNITITAHVYKADFAHQKGSRLQYSKIINMQVHSLQQQSQNEMLYDSDRQNANKAVPVSHERFGAFNVLSKFGLTSNGNIVPVYIQMLVRKLISFTTWLYLGGGWPTTCEYLGGCSGSSSGGSLENASNVMT